MLSEAAIIKRVTEDAGPVPSGVKGIGDDAAVIPFSGTESYVVSKDLLIEDTHFRLRYFDPQSLSHKALHVNLSDIAAMGAKPLFVLLGLSIPHSLDEAWVDAFLHHFAQNCKKQNVFLIGGDTTASPQGLVISVTAIGKAQESQLKFRNGAKSGDILCVAGPLGEAGAGLIALENNITGLESLKQKLLYPNALIHEGIWLGERSGVTAMMDISDGLYVDVSRLCQTSGKGACIELEALLPKEILQAGCRQMNVDALNCILTGGEDYALLFTLSQEDYPVIFQEFMHTFGYPLMPIGKIMEGTEVLLTQQGKAQPFSFTSFSHFGEKDYCNE